MTSSEFLHIQQDVGAVVDDDLRAELISGIGPSSPQALHFGDPAAEYAAARESAVVFDLSDRTHLAITGEDRATFLNSFCTNDVKKLQPGERCEAFITSVKGRVLGHVFITASLRMLWLDTVPGQDEVLKNHLERYIITEDVQITNWTKDGHCLFVTGPKAVELLQQACKIPTVEIDVGGNVETVLVASRVGWLPFSGYVFSRFRESQMTEIWQRMVEGSIQPAGAAAFHTLRIEAGFPWYGVDITDENLPQEVGRTPSAVSFTKGCYLGQEPIARLDAMGHVNKELCILRAESGSLPSAGSVIRSPNEEREIGRITSAARIMKAAPAVALAYLRAGNTNPGTKLVIDARGGMMSAEVVQRH